MTNPIGIIKNSSLLPIFLVSTLAILVTPALAVTPEEVDKLVTSDGHINDHYGYSVGISGDTVVVGAIRHRPANPGPRLGSAYIFVRNSDALNCPDTGTPDPWCQQARLNALDADNNDRFGFWVDIDGDTVVVGSRQDQDFGTYTGSAYVFTRTGGVWSQQAKLLASDAAAWERFGTSVSISGDTILVGAGEADAGTDTFDNSGAAYVFTRTGSNWSEEAKLTPAVAAAGDIFGHYVSVSGDTALLSAMGNDDFGVDAGIAYIFIRNTDAVACPDTATVDPWCQQAILTASDRAAGDWFGGRVALSGDTALVGAPHASGIVADAGAAYVFTRSGTVWIEQAKLTANDGQAGDTFGFGLALTGDTAVISADGDDDLGSSSGSAYVYIRSGDTWTQSSKFYASDGMADDFFGWNVDVTGDTAVITASRPFFPILGSRSSAYIFNINRSETPPGDDVVVEPFPVDENGEPVEDAPDIDLVFESVTGEGDTTVIITDNGPPPPDGFKLAGVSGAKYLDLKTTATFEGVVEICVDYSGFEITGNPDNLKFSHIVDGKWVDITSFHDPVNMIICGVTDTFSFFAIVEIDAPLILLTVLDGDVAALSAKQSVIRSLESMLRAARKKLEDHNPNNDMAAADILMNDFVDSVESRRGKHISNGEADALIESAETIAMIILF